MRTSRTSSHPRSFLLGMALGLAGCAGAGPVVSPAELRAPAPPPETAEGPAAVAPAQDTEPSPDRASGFGVYRGYSAPRYHERDRSSLYVPMSDGTRLAVDIVRPALDGEPVAAPLPTVWMLTRYQRASLRDGEPSSVVDRSTVLRDLVRHGYVVVVVDTRGSGASFGYEPAPHSLQERGHAREITDWIAAQPWSDGHVGMYGFSHSAHMAYLAASDPSPHLDAVFASMGVFDFYDLLHPGGVYREPLMQMWGDYVRGLDTEGAAPVDADPEGELLAEAVAEHDRTSHVVEVARAYPFRDSRADGVAMWQENDPAAHLTAMREHAVPIYHWSGWLDMYVGDAIRWLRNLTGPQKLAIGPWSHASADSARRAERLQLQRTEMLRWFDRWLKGVDNGVDREPRLHYAVIEEPHDWAWREASGWSEPAARRTLYLAGGPTGTVRSHNDGALVTAAEPTDAAVDRYEVDPTASTGRGSRWWSGWGPADLRPNDRKGLTYTSPPLDEDLLVLGHPVVTLFVTTSTPDADLFVYLEEVDGTGASRYVTEGTLRASHRALAQPPFDNLGLPWHRSFAEDVEPMPPGEVVELKLALVPTANVFDRGHRLRLTITGADTASAESRTRDPAPVVRVHRSLVTPSRIELPVDAGWRAERAVRAVMEAFDTGDTSDFPSLFAEDAVYDDMPNARRLRGIEEIAGYVEHVHRWGDSVSMQVESVRAGPGFAVGEWVFRAIQTGPMGQMVTVPTCRWIEIPGITAVTTRDGRIERAVDYIQVMPLIIQVGGRIELPGGTVVEGRPYEGPAPDGGCGSTEP